MSLNYKIGVREYVARNLASRATCWLAKRNRQRETAQICCFPRDAIGLDIVANGFYEDLHLRCLFELAFGSRLQEFSRTTVLDVGANIGNHACWFAGFFSRVIAFEPMALCVHMLKASILMNGFTNIDVFQRALSDDNGTAMFQLNRQGNIGGSRITAKGCVEGENNTIEIPVSRGDDFLQSVVTEGERISLIKMDIEGHEHAALRGLEKTIRSHRPIVIFESHLAQGPDGSYAILDTLADWGLEHVYIIEPSLGGMSKVPKLLHRILNGFEFQVSKVARPEDRFHYMIIAAAEPIPE